MKLKIYFLLQVTLFFGVLNAQQFKIIAFQAGDTVSYGQTVMDSTGNIVLPNYLPSGGEFKLIPTNPKYLGIETHLKKIKEAYNDPSLRMLLEGEKEYISGSLDFALLYRSPFWRAYIEYWAGAYSMATASKEDFATNFSLSVKSVLTRLFAKNEKNIAASLTVSLIQFMETYNQSVAAADIAKYYQSFNPPKDKSASMVDWVLTSYYLTTGDQLPPAITGLKDKKYANSLIVFYNSECGHCQTEMSNLIKNYNILTAKKIRIITIASDEDRNVYENLSKNFPWKDKLCDFKGLDSENFVNYGVFGTPVIYFTNDEGKIKGKYAQFNEIPL
ncbi:MAG: thioredoxin family protein [Prevotellaceae bacterium]|jgi:thiol-disulfide isomerase/thioredoxin|nr:thioredoxin family protein [Prevotellaceae bacterium]